MEENPFVVGFVVWDWFAAQPGMLCEFPWGARWPELQGLTICDCNVMVGEKVLEGS